MAVTGTRQIRRTPTGDRLFFFAIKPSSVHLDDVLAQKARWRFDGQRGIEQESCEIKIKPSSVQLDDVLAPLV